jgi:hypothetical protein
VPSSAVIKRGNLDVTGNYDITYSNGTLTVTKGIRVISAENETYEYDGTSFVVEAVVNAIQNHNAEKAAKSVWGREIVIAADGTLSLKN